MNYDENHDNHIENLDDDESDFRHIDNNDSFVNEYETALREDLLAENPPKSIEQISYENIVYSNTVAALLSGATLTARDGKTTWCLYDKFDVDCMTISDQIIEASVMASYVVG